MPTIVALKPGEKEPEMTLEEKKAFLEAYKLQNPVKYAAKEARGEFKKFLREAAELAEESKKDRPKKEVTQ